MLRRLVTLSLSSIVIATATVLIVAPAQGGDAQASSCGASDYSYAGLQANSTSHGVSAVLTAEQRPTVSDGHVGGWVGTGGVNAGPNGETEWLQAGYASFSGLSDGTIHMYYEVTLPNKDPKYVELDSNVALGTQHRITVLEMGKRKSWWRVWVDGNPVSPAFHLPGSETWYSQAVAENWNGGTGACNDYSYRFQDVSLAMARGGVWKPLQKSYTFHDPGYHVVTLSKTPRTFLAANLAS